MSYRQSTYEPSVPGIPGKPLRPFNRVQWVGVALEMSAILWLLWSVAVLAAVGGTILAVEGGR